jgi:peptide/nickel transport system substrate-binding protein
LSKLPFLEKILKKKQEQRDKINFLTSLKEWFKNFKFPKRDQWKNIPKTLTLRDKKIILLFFVIILGASGAIIYRVLWWNKTTPVPRFGGQFIEGVTGEPTLINPILAQTNEVDMDISQLVYSSLLEYDESGNLKNNVAQNIEILDDGKTYIVTLKDNVAWHDDNNRKLTADDVLFTIQAIQDPKYKSPLKTNWQGVLAEKTGDFIIKFSLKTPYAPFEHNLTFGILPKHVWENIQPENFNLAEFNLKPIGSGPYKFNKYRKDREGDIKLYELEANENYFDQKPYISKFIFKFYDSEDELINAFNKKEVDSISSLSPSKKDQLTRKNDVKSIKIPQYFALFFNDAKNEILEDKNVRTAMALTIKKDEILNEVLSGDGTVINSPIPPGTPYHKSDITRYETNIDEAKKVLESSSWIDKNTDGVREKEMKNEEGVKVERPLEITLTTTSWPDLIKTAQLLQKGWQDIGFRVNLEILELSDIQISKIRPREYQVLLFGEVLGSDPDPFSFWHSSQIKDPGLNLSLYEDTEIDKLLEEARQTTDQNKRIENYHKFQEKIAKDLPAIFLYSPNYLYVTIPELKGFNTQSINIPSKRLANLSHWYLKTRRAKQP